MEVKSGKDRDQHPEQPYAPPLLQPPYRVPSSGLEMRMITSKYNPRRVKKPNLAKLFLATILHTDAPS